VFDPSFGRKVVSARTIVSSVIAPKAPGLVTVARNESE
jgi:hypothetical protein